VTARPDRDFQVPALSFVLPLLWEFSEASWNGQINADEALARFDAVVGQTPPDALLQVLS
jgi:hypothetical protein